MQLGIMVLAVRQPLLATGYISDLLVPTEGCMHLCSTGLSSLPYVGEIGANPEGLCVLYLGTVD